MNAAPPRGLAAATWMSYRMATASMGSAFGRTLPRAASRSSKMPSTSSSMERMRGGTKLEPFFRARRCRRKCAGRLPGNTTRASAGSPASSTRRATSSTRFAPAGSSVTLTRCSARRQGPRRQGERTPRAPGHLGQDPHVVPDLRLVRGGFLRAGLEVDHGDAPRVDDDVSMREQGPAASRSSRSVEMPAARREAGRNIRLGKQALEIGKEGAARRRT